MVQEQIVIQRRENDDLIKRNQTLYDQYTRFDIECNRMTEDLLASNGLLEQLRNECANLRAEKKIWEVRISIRNLLETVYESLLQSIQSRLVEENKILAVERSHLSDLMSNVQKMHNDIEKANENGRRRFQVEAQIHALEAQACV